MEEMKIFLIDLSMGTLSGDSVRQIIASSKNKRFQIIESFRNARSSSSDKFFEAIPRANPDVVILNLASARLEPATTILKRANKGRFKIPVVAVGKDGSAEA
jgi:hypothetical protein